MKRKDSYQRENERKLHRNHGYFFDERVNTEDNFITIFSERFPSDCLQVLHHYACSTNERVFSDIEDFALESLENLDEMFLRYC